MQGKTAALLYMDLDQFKVVNDTCGHGAGDLLLRQLGDILRDARADERRACRLGGDEFAVLLPNADEAGCHGIAESLREVLSAFRFAWRDNALPIGVSIGIVPVEPHSESVGNVMSAADVACYVAKDLGRNRIHVYEEGDAAERHQEMQWVARINRALEEERFELFYQPIVPIGLEQRLAALRAAAAHARRAWRARCTDGVHPSRGALQPDAEPRSLGRLRRRSRRSRTAARPDARRTRSRSISRARRSNDARFLDFVLDELTAPRSFPEPSASRSRRRPRSQTWTTWSGSCER